MFYRFNIILCCFSNHIRMPSLTGHSNPPLSRDDSLEYYIKFPTTSMASTNSGFNRAGHQQQHNESRPLAVGTASAADTTNDYQLHHQMASSATYEETDDCMFMYNETNNVPVVLLLGWAGCQDKYLMKYSKIYEDRGLVMHIYGPINELIILGLFRLITVRYTAPVENLFWKRNAMKPIGEKILKLIFDMSFDGHPLIFHVFSNGGAYLYQHIALAIKKSKRPVQVS